MDKVDLIEGALTLGDLIRILQEYDEDLPVATDNGGNRLAITRDSIRLESGWMNTGSPNRYRFFGDEGKGFLLTVGW